MHTVFAHSVIQPRILLPSAPFLLTKAYFCFNDQKAFSNWVVMQTFHYFVPVTRNFDFVPRGKCMNARICNLCTGLYFTSIFLYRYSSTTERRVSKCPRLTRFGLACSKSHPFLCSAPAYSVVG